MKTFETHTVNHIVVRNSYKDNNIVFKTDAEGDSISFGEKPTNEVVKEIVIMINPTLELKEVHRLLLKVVSQIETKLSNEKVVSQIEKEK